MIDETTSRVLKYGENPAFMAALAMRSGLPSAESAAAAHARLAPVVLEAMANAGRSPEVTNKLLTMARALTWVERDTPEVLFRDRARFGNGLTSVILADSMPAAIASIASTEKLSETDASVLLESIAAVTLATMSGHPDSGPSSETLAAALSAAGGAAVPAALAPSVAPVTTTDAPAEGPAALSKAAPAPAVAATAARTADPTPQADDESKGKMAMLVGGALALVAVAGIAFVTLTGGSGESDTATGDSIPFVAPESTTTSTTEPAATETSVVQPIDAEASDIVSLSVPMVDIFDPERGASGTLNFDFNTITGEVCYNVESINIQGPYRTHIHVGNSGDKGGIVVDMGSLDSGDTGCVDNLPIDTNAILDAKAGHYAELHDISEEWTIRGQLSEATTAGGPIEEEAVVDLDGGGASIVLEGGTVYLEGAVPDQATATELFGSLAGIASATPVVNNLTVEAGAPLPSGRVVIADAVFFDVNSDIVKAIDDQTLAAITALALSRDDWTLTVVGHTDSRGSDVSNLELSLRRATSLRDLLVTQGVPEDTLRIRGAGETAPIGDNSTSAGRAQNRRIEFEFKPNS